ncbi:MAG: DUF1353 domain-containing protein [Nocardioidaceae bacterium]
MPFVTSEQDDTDPTIELAVVPPRRFRLLEGFGYRAQDGSFWDVPADGMSTDLASVPTPLWSLLASYGRQTRPALLHDHISDTAETLPDRRAAFDLRARGDELLRESLAEEGVRSSPRRWTFWAGVTLGKYARHGTTAATVLGLGSLVALWLAWALLAAAALTQVAWWWAGVAATMSVLLWLSNGDLRRDWELWAMSLWLAPPFTVYLVVWFLTAIWIGWPGLFTGASLADVVMPTARANRRSTG